MIAVLIENWPTYKDEQQQGGACDGDVPPDGAQLAGVPLDGGQLGGVPVLGGAGACCGLSGCGKGAGQAPALLQLLREKRKSKIGRILVDNDEPFEECLYCTCIGWTA